MTASSKLERTEDEGQQELFPTGIHHKPDAPAPSYKKGFYDNSIYGRSQRFFLRVPYEVAVFAAVGTIILIALAYIIGSEKGKKDVLSFRGNDIQAVLLDHLTVKPVPDNDMLEADARHGPVQMKQPLQNTSQESRAETKAVDSRARSALSGEPAGDFFYSIQVASFKDKLKAEAGKSRLIKEYKNAYVLKTKSQSTGTIWYKIYVGIYKTFAKAKAQKPKMVKKGFTDCIIKKVNRDFYKNNVQR